MGWMRYMLLGDWGQQMDLEDQRAEIDQLKRSLRHRHAVPNNDSEIERLSAENDELKLYVAALYRLLIQKRIATPDEIRTLVEKVDAADGQADGAFRGDVVPGRPTAVPPESRTGGRNPFADLE
ncbi:MAG: hypothetical protein JNM56_38675 [Planctomycetia bacterium]|nr:hypothetical protein [Planctomycetia bacterium]